MKKLSLIFLLLFVGYAGVAQNYQLHAVYIYSFIRYIQWPESTQQGDFVIGVLGDTPLEQHLRKMAEVKKAGDRKIVIKKFSDATTVKKTDILFVSESYEDFNAALEKVGNNNTLIITEKEGQGKRGSNINFIVRDGRLAFELNRAAMQRANLQVSTELTKLAIII